MKYIAHRRFRKEAIYSPVNIPAKTELTCEDGMITYKNTPICRDTSDNAHQYFTRNDDGQGMERGRLTQAIQKTLANRDEHYQERWDRVWEDPLCQKYKRPEYADYWLWNHDFFNADIGDLRYIAKLIGAKR